MDQKARSRVIARTSALGIGVNVSLAATRKPNSNSFAEVELASDGQVRVIGYHQARMISEGK